MNRIPIRILLLQCLMVLLMTAPFLVAGLYVWQKHQQMQAVLADLEPRHARLQGVRQAKPTLDQAVTTATAFLSNHVYPASVDATQAGNAAQQRIRSIFADSQMNIESIQVLEAKDMDDFQRIGVTVRVEGTQASLQEALLKLEAQSPTILVDGLSLQSTGVVKPASTQRLIGNFTLAVLRAKS